MHAPLPSWWNMLKTHKRFLHWKVASLNLTNPCSTRQYSCWKCLSSNQTFRNKTLIKSFLWSSASPIRLLVPTYKQIVSIISNNQTNWFWLILSPVQWNTPMPRKKKYFFLQEGKPCRTTLEHTQNSRTVYKNWRKHKNWRKKRKDSQRFLKKPALWCWLTFLMFDDDDDDVVVIIRGCAPVKCYIVDAEFIKGGQGKWKIEKKDQVNPWDDPAPGRWQGVSRLLAKVALPASRASSV